MLSVTILGTSSAIPVAGRNPSAQVLNHDERLVLLDCGEGTLVQAQRFDLRLSRLDAVFISHLHGDHIFGLPGLLTTLSILGRSRTLVLVGPVGLAALLRTIFNASRSELAYPLELLEVPPGHPPDTPLTTVAGLTVYAQALDHRIACWGYKFCETPRQRPLLSAHPDLVGVPPQYFGLLKLGNDITLPDGRRVVANGVLGPPPMQHSYAYCTDTRYLPKLAPWLAGVDVLYHEATFLHALKRRAEHTRHSTALEAAQLAQAAGVGTLLLGHYSARYTDLTPLLAEAQTVFERTLLAREGLKVPVPAP